jgi:hypothetical protein
MSYYDTVLHYLTFIRRDLGNRRKPTPIRIMNSVGMNNKDIVNIDDIFSDMVVLISRVDHSKAFLCTTCGWGFFVLGLVTSKG